MTHYFKSALAAISQLCSTAKIVRATARYGRRIRRARKVAERIVRMSRVREIGASAILS